jgi:hypothetical protein
VTGAEGFSRLGNAIAAGDVNGDGMGDLVVGAPFAGREPGTPPGSARTTLGEVYVVFGDEGLSGEANIARLDQDVLISGAHASGEFGGALAVADINGDGLGDIIAGAHRSNLGDESRGATGAAYLFLGREEFPERLTVQGGDEDMRLLGRTPSAFGYPLASGDFNGDDIDDVAIGAKLESTGEGQGQGTVRVFFGGSELPGEVDLSTEGADVTLAGQMTSEFLPTALGSVDLDGDGADELLAGSILLNADDERFGSGAVYIVKVLSAAPGVVRLPASATVVFPGAGGERLGNSLFGGETVAGTQGIAIAAPGASPPDRPGAGIVYLTRVRQ